MPPQHAVTFDAAHLADAVGKAARVAPTRGAGGDKSAGIVFKVTEGQLAWGQDFAQVRATDLEVHYWQNLPVVETKGFDPGEVMEWRLPSTTISKLAASLTLDASLQVKFIDVHDGWLRIKAGRMNVKLPMIPMDTYPLIKLVDPTGMVEANDFATKVGAVSWATGKNGVLSGIHVTGTELVGCDGYTLASIPCAVAIAQPITVPLGTLVGLLKDATDVRLAAMPDRLEMALDKETEAACTIFGDPYPAVGAIMGRPDMSVASIMFSKSTFVETADRMLTVVPSEKSPRLECTIEEGALVLDVDEPELGRIREVIDANVLLGEGMSFADMPMEQRQFAASPTYLKQAVNACRSGRVNIRFGHRTDPDAHWKWPLVVSDDETGYKAWVQTLRPKEGQ